MRYIIYRRVSTKKQQKRESVDVDIEDEDGLGLQAQSYECRQWIAKQSIQGEIIEFTDIVTGTDKQRRELEGRPQLIEALACLQKDDVIITSKRDRMSRDPYINCMIEREVEKKKAVFVTADGSHYDNGPGGILMRRMIDAFAEYEALVISMRIKAAFARKKSKGERMGHIPYGWKLDEKRRLVVNSDEARVLSVMYDMRIVNKFTFREIAKRLNKLGYRNRGESLWTHGATSRVYKNYGAVYEAVQPCEAHSVDQKRSHLSIQQ